MLKLLFFTFLVLFCNDDSSTKSSSIFAKAFTTCNYKKNPFPDQFFPLKSTRNQFTVGFLKTSLSKRMKSTLFSSNEQSTEIEKDDSVRRLSFLGGSVSPLGFIALLSTASTDETSMVLPIRISSTSDDEYSATSVEALAFLQLLAGVDMASEGVLPVQTLERIVALNCSFTMDEDSNSQTSSQKVDSSDARTIMERALSDVNYVSATPWQRVRVKMPKVGLDEVRIVSAIDNNIENSVSNPTANVGFILACTVEGKPLPIQLSLPVAQDISSSASFTSDQLTENIIAFYSLALALRYKVPITISSVSLSSLSSSILFNPDGNNMNCTDENTLLNAYPKWKSVTSLQFQSSRVLKTIERGFEANSLDGALRIAIQKGDKEAEKKIREKMKEFESLDDLPLAKGVGSDKMVLEDDNEDSWA